jgi:hypothetical protein
MANSIGVGTPKETFLLTEQTLRGQVDPRLVMYDRPEQVAHVLAEDLRLLIDHAALDLAAILGISLDDYLSHSEDLAEELCDDIERLLQHRLLTAVHLLLCDPLPDPQTGSYRVRYHMEYAAALPRIKTPEPSRDALQRLLASEQGQLERLHVALVVDWDARADMQKRAQLRRPQYNFDWYAEHDPRYEKTVVRFSPAVIRPGASLLSLS